MAQVIIAGCGYVGERLAKRFRRDGVNPLCLVRSEERQTLLAGAGFESVRCNLDEAGSALPSVDGAVIFYLVPPPGGGFDDSRTRQFIHLLDSAGTPAKIIYMSTTAVYGDAGGAVVTEEHKAQPDTARGKRRLDAEQVFAKWCGTMGVPFVILRVTGIYGPGRLPLHLIRQGQALLREEDAGITNRIHVDDLVNVCMRVSMPDVSNDVFNVSDGSPSTMTAYFNAVAEAAGLPRQPQVSREEARDKLTPLMYSYATESRLVDNSKIRVILGIKLKYPDLASGLRDSLREDEV